MPIVVQSGGSNPNPDSTTTAEDILECTSQDVRKVLNPDEGITAATDTAILLDYTNRISLQMLRFSRWRFLESAPQLFVTVPGVTDYFIGNGTQPFGTVNTGLAISDLQSVKKNMVFNRSTYTGGRALYQTADPPLNWVMQLPQKPLFWRNDISSPGVLNVYPIPDNNGQQPPLVPGGPIATFTAGGALPQRTYSIVTAFIDSTGGISQASVENTFVVPANHLITIGSPVIEVGGASPVVSLTTASGVTVGNWSVYASTQTAHETLQSANIAIGTAWTEPTSGLTTSGAAVPSSPTIALLGGYIIEFRYYKTRAAITAIGQTIQIPDQYKDIVCAGVNWLAYKYLKKDDEAQIWQGVYKTGMTEMIRDKNLFPRTDYINPDPYAVHTSINNGTGLDSGMEWSIP